MPANTKSLAHFNGTSSDEVPGVSWDLSSGSSIYTSGGYFGSGMLQLPPGTNAGFSGLAGNSGDHTVEGWFYLNGTTDQEFRVEFLPSSGNGGVYARFTYNSGNPYSEFSGYQTDGNLAFQVTTTASFPSAGWNHYALVRSGGSNFYLWLNGSLFLSSSYGGSIGTLDRGTLYGYFNDTVYVDECRVSNIARYTTGFTPPSQEFLSGVSGVVAVTLGNDTISATGSLGTTFGAADTAITSEYGDLLTAILLGAEDTATTTSDTANLTTAQDIGAEDTAITSEYGNLLTVILLGAEDAAATSEYGNLFTQAATTYLTPESDGSEDYDSEPKPAIPPTTDIDPRLLVVLDAMKENIETITGRRTGPLAALESDATLADVIEKVNQISRRLNA